MMINIPTSKGWTSGAKEGFNRIKAAINISAKAVGDAARVIARGPRASVIELADKPPEVLRMIAPSVDQMLVEYSQGVDEIVADLVSKIHTTIRKMSELGPSPPLIESLMSYLHSLDKVLTDMIKPMLITQQSPVISLNNVFIEFRKRLAKTIAKAIPDLCKIRNGRALRPIVDAANDISRHLFIVSQKMAFEQCPGSSCSELDIIINRIAESLSCVDMSG